VQSVTIICGPTGSGKSSYAIEYAKEHDGEIVNCDFAQCYSCVSIGTARPLEEDMQGVPHHLYGFQNELRNISSYTLKSFIEKSCFEIISRGKRPIVVGGSIFYIYSLFFDSFQSLGKGLQHSVNYDYYDQYDNNSLWNILCGLDRKRAESLHVNDRYRIVRSIEIIKAYGKIDPIVFNPRFIYEIKEKKVFKDLHLEKIQMIIDLFFKKGWLEEVRGLTDDERNFVRDRKFIGYDSIINYINGLCNEQQMREDIFIKTRQYIKKQKTFIRKLRELAVEKNISWQEI
jgi:tRNA dimethylallyltransferase